MGLQSLERRLERMVEGVFRGSRSAIRPIELGRRLVREMDDQRSVDVKGRRVVPNDFMIQLSPVTSPASPTSATCCRRSWSRRLAITPTRRATTSWAPCVSSSPRRGAAPRPVRRLATLRQAAGGIGAGSLVLPSGQRVPLGDRPVTIGRMDDCTVPLNDQNVSRRHAEIHPGRGTYVVNDLGSTNGTMVNGTRIPGEQRLSTATS